MSVICAILQTIHSHQGMERLRTLYCNAPGIGDDVTDYIACRPDWCPLRKLPTDRSTAYADEPVKKSKEGYACAVAD